ncbi:MAG: hypothetical protein D6795_18125 [Deltaproteobacteria bacterium]|nr:MAG: hypothetical protein D6795_18125 [Deltaproteobacteria bacterium]
MISAPCGAVHGNRSAQALVAFPAVYPLPAGKAILNARMAGSINEGFPDAVVRVHTATLISSAAALPIHRRPIEGRTDEVGAMPVMLEERHAVHGRSGIIRLVTADAGNLAGGGSGLPAGCDCPVAPPFASW